MSSSPLRTNVDRLPIVSVQGAIAHPRSTGLGYLTPDGSTQLISIGIGGIAYNVRVGDPALGWVADHIEPGVSIRNPEGPENLALAYASCVGNRATVVTGAARGSVGFVTGKHGGTTVTDMLLVDFAPDVLDALVIGDQILVRAWGQGLAFTDVPDVVARNLGPELLPKLPLTLTNGVLEVGVAARAPASIMGSGIGMGTTACGDYDINLFDPATVESYGLDKLRLGDLVLIEDADTRFGRSLHQGFGTVGIVIHGASVMSGHGPGVVTLLSGPSEHLRAVVQPGANLADLFGVTRT